MLNSLSLYQDGDVQGAVRNLKEIIIASPSYTIIYSHLAKIFKEIGKIDLSVSILEEGLEKNPGEPFLLSKLGIFLVEKGEFKRAVDIL